jgi:hypothetical protein
VSIDPISRIFAGVGWLPKFWWDFFQGAPIKIRSLKRKYKGIRAHFGTNLRNADLKKGMMMGRPQLPLKLEKPCGKNPTFLYGQFALNICPYPKLFLLGYINCSITKILVFFPFLLTNV